MSNRKVVIELNDDQRDRAKELIRVATYFGRLTKNQAEQLFELWNEFSPVKKEFTRCVDCLIEMIEELKKLVA